MAKVKHGNLRLGQMTKEENIPGTQTPVLTYEIPNSEAFLLRDDKRFKLRIPTRVEKEHAGNGEEEFDLSTTYVDTANDDEDSNASIANSAGLPDSKNAMAVVTDAQDTKLDITTVDYENNKVKVDHDTNENIYIYFYPEEGQVSIEVISPIAGGNLSEVLFDSPMFAVHSVDQKKEDSTLMLHQSYPAPENYFLHVEYEGEPQIKWDPEGYMGRFTLAYKDQGMSYFRSRNIPIEDILNRDMISN